MRFLLCYGNTTHVNKESIGGVYVQPCIPEGLPRCVERWWRVVVPALWAMPVLARGALPTRLLLPPQSAAAISLPVLRVVPPLGVATAAVVAAAGAADADAVVGSSTLYSLKKVVVSSGAQLRCPRLEGTSTRSLKW